MDEFLSRLGVQAVNYAMRCGIALTSTFALQQCSRLIKTVDNKPQHAELQRLQTTLNDKIKIVSPALDLIEFKSGRGNVFLGNAAVLAKALHRDIVALGRRLETAAAAEEECARTTARTTSMAAVAGIIDDIKRLLARIDGDIPLLQLAITASGESLTTALPPSISPSRLLQASMFLVVGDAQFASSPARPVQIGPSFTLSLYMLFVGHAAAPAAPSGGPPNDRRGEPYGVGEDARQPVWQEVLHKARVRVCRTLPHWRFCRGLGYAPDTRLPKPGPDSARAADEAAGGAYAYHLEIIEDLDDGRAHDADDGAGMAYDSLLPHAGIQTSIPIHQISKLFYTDSGRILNIGGANDFENAPVLLLKRDREPATEDDAREPDADQSDVDRQLREESCGREHAGGSTGDGNGRWQLPPHLDPEWLALEVFAADGADEDASQHDTDGSEDDGDDDDAGSGAAGQDGDAWHRRQTRPTPTPPPDGHLAEQMRNMAVSDSQAQQQSPAGAGRAPFRDAQPPFGPVISSLSLLEMLVRLTSLQAFQQTPHLSIPDHILTFFLEEASTTGLRGAAQWQARQAAKQKMGFDPFTDTPTR